MYNYLIKRYYVNDETFETVKSNLDAREYLNLVDSKKKPLKIEVYKLVATEFYN